MKYFKSLPGTYFKNGKRLAVVLSIGRTLHWVFLAGVYAFLALKSFLQFSRLPDLLAFHLPRGLSYFDLTTYQYGAWAVEQAKGYPPLPNFLQGLLVWLTGQMSVANAVNVLGFAFACAWLYFLFPKKSAVRFFLTFCLGLPIFYYHLSIGFIDLFTASMILLGFAGLHNLILRFKPGLSALAMLTGFTLAMFSSMTAWPIVGMLSVCGLFFLWKTFHSRKLKWYQAGTVGLLMIVGIAFYPVRNFLVFGNPTYPVEVRLVVNLFPEFTVISPVEQPNFPRFMEKQGNILRFFASLFELNRFDSYTPYSWTSFEKHGTIFHRDNPGGFFLFTMLLMAMGLFWGYAKSIFPNATIGILLWTTFFISTLPNYSVMRYVLYIPLVSFFLISYYLPSFEPRVRRLLLTGFAICIPIVMSNLGNTFWQIDSRPPEAFASNAAQAFWKDKMRNPDDAAVHISGAYPNTIFWSGPDFNTYKIVEDLTMEDRFKNTLIEVER